MNDAQWGAKRSVEETTYVVKSEANWYLNNLRGWRTKQSEASRFPGKLLAKIRAQQVGGRVVRLRKAR